MDGAVIAPTARKRREAAWALFASVVVTALLFVVPYGHVVGRPLVWLSTLAHELGHGITAILVGGSFGRLELYADASGMAWTSAGTGWRSGAVAAGGLVGPAIAGAACFVAGRREKGARRALATAALLLLGVAAVWVRNPFGFAFVISLAFAAGAIAWKLPARVARFVVMFLGVQLSLAVFARSDYLFVPEARTATGTVPSDVAKIAEVFWLPYWMWGAVCGLFSVIVLIVGLRIAFLPGSD